MNIGKYHKAIYDACPKNNNTQIATLVMYDNGKAQSYFFKKNENEMQIKKDLINIYEEKKETILGTEIKQIKILDTKNYTNDAILREKIEENNADYLKQKFQYKGNEYVYAKYEDKNELRINIVDSNGKQIYYHFENENITDKTIDPLRLDEKFFKALQKEDIIDKFERYDLYEIGNQMEVLYEKYKNEDNHDLELFDSKKDNENEEKTFFVKKNGENFIVNHNVKDNKGVCDESFLISKYNQGKNGLYSMTFMSQFLSRRDEAQTKTIKLKTGFTLYNEENKNIPLIIYCIL